jgi:hypothetical protein
VNRPKVPLTSSDRLKLRGALLFCLGGRASNSIQTMATDGVFLFYNPAFVDTLNAAELAGMLGHLCCIANYVTQKTADSERSSNGPSCTT